MSPVHLPRRSAAQELRSGEHAGLPAEQIVAGRQRREGLLLLGGERAHLLIDPRKVDATILVHEAREHLAQRHGRIGYRPTPHAAVHRLLQRFHLDLHGDDAAQRRRDRRQARIEVRGIGQHDRVRLQQIAVLLQERGQRAGTGFFLTLHDHLHVDGQRSVRLQPGIDRRDVDEDACLVVGGAAREEAPVALDGLEGIRLVPLLLLAGGLYVVMRVEQ